MVADRTGRGMVRLPAVLLWMLVWMLNIYEFLLAF